MLRMDEWTYHKHQWISPMDENIRHFWCWVQQSGAGQRLGEVSWWCLVGTGGMGWLSMVLISIYIYITFIYIYISFFFYVYIIGYYRSFPTSCYGAADWAQWEMPEFALGYWGSQFSDKPGGQPPDVGPLWAAHPTSAPTYPTARSDLGFAQRGFLQARDQVWNGPSDQGTFPELCTLSDSVGSTCLRCGIIVQFERWWDRRGGKTRAMQMEFLWTLNIGRGTSKQSRVLYQKGTQFRIGDSGEESNSCWRTEEEGHQWPPVKSSDATVSLL